MHNKKILVTGGAGFIGSELTRQLVQIGAQVVVVDNLINGKSENLEELKGDIQLEIHDIRDLEKISSLLSGVDIIYHLACLGVRHSIHSPLENHSVNADATLKLLECARKTNVGRFVYVSSSEVYGTARWIPMTEEHPTYPHTVYGASKLAGESYVRAYYDTYQFPTVIVRPFNSYGPRSHHEGDSGEVIPKFILRGMLGKPMIIFGDGTQRRDFTYVSDTARGILLAGQKNGAIGETINLGSGKEIDINTLAEEVATLLRHKEVNIQRERSRAGDVLRLLADSSKAERILNYKASISFQTGLALLHQWYLEKQQSLEHLLKEDVVYNWEK